MLGELIYEGRGKRTARAIASLVGAEAKVEVSFEESGKLLGAEASFIASYWAATRPDGTLYGEGQGVMVAAGVFRVARLSDFYHGGAAELAAPDHERRVEQAPLFQVLEERGGGLVGDVAVFFEVAIQIGVLVPACARRAE